MANLPPRFNWGAAIKNINDTLYNQLNDVYTSIARILNGKVTRNIQSINPPADSVQNAAFEIGDIWVNSSTDTAWIMTSRITTNKVTWTLIT